MVTIPALWLPILLSAVFVFIVSSIIHMVLTYHRADFRKLNRESEIMDALRPYQIAEGEYMVPFSADAKERSSPEFLEKVTKGPVAILTVWKSGPPTMGMSLIQWFAYCVIVGVFAAYIAGRALGPDASYLSVFRFAGATAFAGYALALLQNSIWYKRSWGTTFRSMFDGLIYAALTAGTFGWLWPSG